MENIDFTVFTQDEKESIEKLLEMRMPEHIASSILNMDGKKEIEIQKIIAQSNPIVDVNENQVREFVIQEYYKINPKGPQSPEEEIELQKQLDEELNNYHTNQKEKANNQVNDLQQETINVLNEERFCEFCDSRGVKHKLNCTRIIK